MTSPKTNNNLDRLGYYLVGLHKFHNKTLALMHSRRTGVEPKWVFNSLAYGKIDWRLPIEESLVSIYRRRALQLRERYDYLILYFSGGVDSMNMLHAFIDNDIFLDEIVMQIPDAFKPTANNTDQSNANFYSEIIYSAEPHLRKYASKIDSRTKISYQDFGKPLIEMLNRDNWLEIVPLCTNITVSGLGRQLSQTLQHDLYPILSQNKKIAQILGIDKPLVECDGTNYYAYFVDLSTTHCPPVNSVYAHNSQDGIVDENYCTEYFYWTPDMPEIVVKQAQEIKRTCESNPAVKKLWMENQHKHIQYMREVMTPIIYPAHIKTEFQTDKPLSYVIRSQDNWFWRTAAEPIKRNYLEAINFLKNHINERHANGNNLMKGLGAHHSPRYLL